MKGKAEESRQLTKIYKQYRDGVDYNNRVGLYRIVNENERMYAGDQWHGVKSNGLPTPVFNIFKRVINFFVASILSQPVKIKFVPELIGDDPDDPMEKELDEIIKMVNGYMKVIWEKNKLPSLLRDVLTDAALAGDGYLYVYFDAAAETGLSRKGAIKVETLDSTAVIFGDPNTRDKECQPYIIIKTRELISELKKQAEANGIPESSINLILADEDVEEEAGDLARIESKDEDGAKANAYILLKKDDDGKVMATKVTKMATIRKEWDTKLCHYPICFMPWDKRKNSYRGQALGTGLVPNQRYINKMFAMMMLFLMRSAFPKVIYNKKMIAAWSSKVGAAIGVNGDVNAAASVLETPKASQMVMNSIDYAINYTKEMLGATDAALGDVKPDNTSAIVMVTKQAAIPLENQHSHLYQMVEDFGIICLDIMANQYGKRKIVIEEAGARVKREVDFKKLKKAQLQTTVEVGASAFYSDIAANQTLDNLLNAERITFLQYLERVSDGLIPDLENLIDEVKGQSLDQTILFEAMARYIEGLPPELREQLSALPPDEMELEVKRLMVENMG